MLVSIDDIKLKSFLEVSFASGSSFSMAFSNDEPRAADGCVC